MKLFKTQKLLGLFVGFAFFMGVQSTITYSDEPTAEETQDQEPIVIFFVDPDDKETMEALATEKIDAAVKKIEEDDEKTLDELIEEALAERVPYSKRHKRIAEKVLKDELKFLEMLDAFIKTDFDVEDDNSHAKFNEIRAELVELIFDAPSERIYYERLYLINITWLEHQEETARFASLDEDMVEHWQDIAEKRRRIRQLITVGAGAIGTFTGGFLSFKAAQKIIPVSAQDTGMRFVFKMGLRAPIVIFGAGVGAAAGSYLGFLGSGALLNNRDFVDPIDGSEDLRDILDVIESLPEPRRRR
jgi:hypothetical protein